MKILFAGIIARYPFGGVTWCSLMYLLGLRALGHEVFYIEDTGECVYDPVQNTRATDPGYGTTYIHDALEPFGLGDRWAFVNYDGSYHGQSADAVRRFCADADLFLNLSGGSWFWRDEYARIPRKAFIDSDPAFTQLAIAKAEPWYVRVLQAVRPPLHVRREHRHAGVADPRRRLRLAQDVAAGDARPLADRRAAGDRFTTVMTWQIESFTDVGGNKDQEFVKFIDLPSRTAQPFELAVNGPQTLLREHGWSTVDAMGVSRSAVGLPRFHPALEGRVRRGQAHLRVDAVRLVQRSHGVLSGVRPPGAGAGHGMERAPARRRGAARLLVARRGAGRHRRASTATTPATPGAPPRSPASTSTPAACCTRLARTTAWLVTTIAAHRPRRPGRHRHPAAEVGVGRADDVAADRRARRRAATT